MELLWISSVGKVDGSEMFGVRQGRMGVLMQNKVQLHY